jgi:hypothetical protein
MHIIRLRGPWACEHLQGAVRFTRRFHCPTGLDAASRVWLAIDEVDGRATVMLNDRLCGEIASSATARTLDDAESQRCPGRFDVTADLLPHNVLSITVPLTLKDSDGLPGELIGAVRLEIESQASAREP